MHSEIRTPFCGKPGCEAPLSMVRPATPPFPYNAVEVRIKIDGESDEAVIDRLSNLLTDWHLYGIRHTLGGGGIVEVDRRPEITPEIHHKQLAAYVAFIREERDSRSGSR